jgi:hypothetical protein
MLSNKLHVGITSLSFPSAFRSRLDFILPWEPTNKYTENMFYAKQSKDQLVIEGPVLARPWEWLDHNTIGTSTTATADTRSDVLVNNGSLSLHMFGIKLTGEKVRTSQDRYLDRARAEVRNGDNMISSESVFERDWIEGRVTWTGYEEPDEPAETQTQSPDHDSRKRGQPPAESPQGNLETSTQIRRGQKRPVEE